MTVHPFALGKAAVTALALCGVLTLGACAIPDGFLVPAGPVAEAQRHHFLSIIAWMTIVIVPLFIALPWVIWKYRLANRQSNYRPDWEFSWLLEILVWGLPAIVVGVLGWNLWRETLHLDPYRPIASSQAPLHVDVVAMDWKWLFIYPDQGIAMADQLVIPAGRPVRFRLTSATVMQSFMIPRLGGQIYVMPAMTTELNLMADHPGRFRGQNTQFNGKGFAKQKFSVEAVTGPAFASWVATVQASGRTLDRAAMENLLQPSSLDRPIVFGNAPGNVLEQIVARTAQGEPPGLIQKPKQGPTE